MKEGLWKKFRFFLLKNCKIVFPIVVMIAVAITVVFALNAHKTKKEIEQQTSISEQEIPESEEEVMAPVAEDVPLLLNEDEQITSLIESYLYSLAEGDSEAMSAVCDKISQKRLFSIVEFAKYIKNVELKEIYVKAGYSDNTYIAYVSYYVDFGEYGKAPGREGLYVATNDEGQYYLRMDEDSFTEEEYQYIEVASRQGDVIDFNNRIEVEYSELLTENPGLLEYLEYANSHVQEAVGIKLAELAEQEAASEPTPEEDITTVVDTGNEIIYAHVTTTVNVRSSDSENADKLGQLVVNGRVRVLEEKVNGWTKVLFQSKEGYIKSEHLVLEERYEDTKVIGIIKANTAVNVRSQPDLSANTKLGILTKGEELDLVSIEGEWCKVRYKEQIAYVYAKYVTRVE